MSDAQPEWHVWAMAIAPVPMAVVTGGIVWVGAEQEPYGCLMAADAQLQVMGGTVMLVLWAEWLAALIYLGVRGIVPPGGLVAGVPLASVALFYGAQAPFGYLSDFDGVASKFAWAETCAER